jgi:hypothetical protein
VGEISVGRDTNPGRAGRASTAATLDGMVVVVARRLVRDVLAVDSVLAVRTLEVAGDEVTRSMCCGREVICNEYRNPQQPGSLR